MAGFEERTFPASWTFILKKIRINKLLLFALLAALFFGLAVGINKSDTSNGASDAKVAKSTELKLQAAKVKLDGWIKSSSACLAQSDFSDCIRDHVAERSDLPLGSISFLVYEKDSLLFWSDNRVAFASPPSFFDDDRQLIRYRNGWFMKAQSKIGHKVLVGLLLVKNEYSYQNKYLSNDFVDFMHMPHGASLEEKAAVGALPLRDVKGAVMAYLSRFDANETHAAADWSTLLLQILALLFFMLAIRVLGSTLSISNKPFAITLLFFIGLVLLRLVSLYYQWPVMLYQSELFDPQYFASSALLNSLGDLLLNGLLLFYVTSYCYRYVSIKKQHDFLAAHRFWIAPALSAVVFLIFLLTAGALLLLRTLIFNSSISFDASDMFSLSSLSLYSFIAIALILSSLLMITDAAVRFFMRDQLLKGVLWISFLVALVPFVLVLWLMPEEYSDSFDRLSTGLFAITLPVVLYSLRSFSKENLSFSRVLIIVFLFTFICAFKISIYNTIKERASRMLLAEKLDKEKDHVAEHLFEDIELKVAKDSVLPALFDSSPASKMEPIAIGIRRLHQIYFNGYWSKYDSKLHAYDALGNGLYNSNNENVGLDYFDKLIHDFGQTTYSKNFIFLNFSNGRTSYIARLPIYRGSNPNTAQIGTILVELDSKLRQEESGFPDLLLSDKVSGNTDAPELVYSYARYQKGKLSFQSGNFPYYLSSSAFGSNTGAFLDKEGYNHYLYHSADEVLVVVSVRNRALIDYITLFSYLFAFFLLFTMLLALFGSFPLKIASPVLADATFSSRIQLYMMVIVLVSLLITGSGTAYYIMNKYHAEQYVHLRQRVSSLLVAVQNQVVNKQQLDNSILRNMTYDLMSLSVSSGVDFNIYDLKGNVLFSTQPKLYEQEVIAERMNASAFKQLQREQRSSLIQDEQIGGLQYIAAYESVRNSDNALIGYLGLPFFSRQSELKKEISSFLIALVNIYVLLFGLALILAYLITERITQPLKVIRQRISKIRLGSRSEPMVWEAQDEIGALIQEYNRMVNELALSAERLAKSERESAWREMARQVAHEIKNPLTPMKLSVQYLERASNDRSPDLESIIKKISRTLIEQIDTLSHIASEFSNFAQMPKARNAKVDVKGVIQGLLGLFIDHEQTTLTFEPQGDEDYLVFADRDQLSRVFTNLINNALQSIPEGRRGDVVIGLSVHDDKVIIEVSDNGTGIDADLAERIFEPNFTTKSSGMGLGLAMVKNIVEQADGRIWFETVPQIGTRFFVEMPQFKGTPS